MVKVILDMLLKFRILPRRKQFATANPVDADLGVLGILENLLSLFAPLLEGICFSTTLSSFHIWSISG
jgi:hypothetical protein